MPILASPFDLDRLGSSYLLLGSILAVALAAGLLFWLGVVGWVLALVRLLIQGSISLGFRLWERTLAWASWPLFLALVAVLLALGLAAEQALAPLAVVWGLVLLLLGVTTCLAYMAIDLERYEVARGHLALHNPLKGQRMAVNLVRHGGRLGVLMLACAAAAVVAGFALLNQGLYLTVGPNWYRLGEGKAEPGYSDFLAYTLINLLGVVDLLHIASSYNYVHATYVQQARWPASTLLTLFKSFFTAVLLQQIFASVRRGRLLSETIADFWSPHPPVHERARVALPQHGPSAVGPLLLSFRSVEALTAEQREYLPRVIADIGPAAVPTLSHHLRDDNRHVRGVATAALGLLHARDAVPALVELQQDSEEWVRQCLAGALGAILSASGATGRRRRVREVIHASRAWAWGALRRWLRRPQPLGIDPVYRATTTLTALLSDPSSAVRAEAARGLGLAGKVASRAADDLHQALNDPDEPVRCRAAEALACVAGASDSTVAALGGLLAEPSPALRVAAATALGGLGKEAADAVPALLPLLRERDEAVRQAAADAIGRIGTLTEDALRPLAEGLSSQDNVVRARTAEALGQIGEAAAEAAPALAEALQDDNDRVRAKAAEALGKMGEGAAEAVPVLVRALRDQDNWVSALAAEALGEIGDPAVHAVPALIRALRHFNPQVRANAATSLGKMGSTAAASLGELRRAARDSEDAVRSGAVFALGEVGSGDGESGQVLLGALRDPSPAVRATAAEAIGKRQELNEATRVALIAAADDPSDQVQVEVARALARLRAETPEAIEALARLLEDDNPAVQVQAAQALGQLGAAATPAGDALLRQSQAGEASVREEALLALAQVQPPQAITAFLAGLRDPQPRARKLASAGLITAPEVPEEAVGPLIETLGDPESQVRANAARALSRRNTLPPEAVKPLLSCAADPDDGVRLGAALALRAVPADQARPAFLAHLHDPTQRLRLLAAGSLLEADPADPEATAALAKALADPTIRVRRAALEWVAAHETVGDGLVEALRGRAESEDDPEVSGLLGQVLDRLDQSAAPGPT